MTPSSNAVLQFPIKADARHPKSESSSSSQEYRRIAVSEYLTEDVGRSTHECGRAE